MRRKRVKKRGPGNAAGASLNLPIWERSLVEQIEAMVDGPRGLGVRGYIQSLLLEVRRINLSLPSH